MKKSRYETLEIWQLSMQLCHEVYEGIRTFPAEERYGLTSQIRRSAVSVPSNIAEGSMRTSKKEFAHFLSISVGSLAELETQLIIAQKENYLDRQKLVQKRAEIKNLMIKIAIFKKSLNTPKH